MESIRVVVVGLLVALGASCATSSVKPETNSTVANACAGVPLAEQATNPLISGRVVAVEPLRESPDLGRGAQLLKGAKVILASSPGMTQQWMQRLFECNAARRAVAKEPVANDPCPLGLASEVPTVIALPDGFAVALRTDDVDEANVLLRECRSLVGLR